MYIYFNAAMSLCFLSVLIAAESFVITEKATSARRRWYILLACGQNTDTGASSVYLLEIPLYYFFFLPVLF